MHLTTKGRYAVMAMVEIAINPSNQPITLEKLSDAQNIPKNYLEQIFVQLRKSGLVKSIRGPGGGYVMNDSPNKVTISRIIHAVNENITMTRCSGKDQNGCMPNKSRCKTHELWSNLGKKIDSYLTQISVQDVIDGGCRI